MLFFAWLFCHYMIFIGNCSANKQFTRLGRYFDAISYSNLSATLMDQCWKINICTSRAVFLAILQKLGDGSWLSNEAAQKRSR